MVELFRIILEVLGFVWCLEQLNKLRNKLTVKKCSHTNKELIFIDYAYRCEQYRCPDCGEDVYEGF